MNISQASLKNPYLVIVVVLITSILGITAVTKIPADILPIFKTPAIQIVTFYPGMPPEIVERDITNRLERWTSQANGVATQESKSILGVSIVRDFFREDIDPNTALSQVSSLAISDLFYLPPGTIPPLVLPFDPTATIPLALLSVSSNTLNESQLYDIAYFNIRNQLSGITGTIAPAVYGGKIRRILVYLDPMKLKAHGLTSLDITNVLKKFNVIIPTGDVKIGDLDYQLFANSNVLNVKEINDFPIKTKDGQTIFIKDIGQVKDTHQIQTNVVHINGKRQVYIPIYRQPGANTIEVVEGVKKALTRISQRIPKEVKLEVILDQSNYVKEAIASLIKEGVLGGILATVLILIFMGSFRSTFVIFLSIPLSILATFLGLFFTHNTTNIMTLGGIALAVGRLIDDSIVVLENIIRHLHMGKKPSLAAIEGAQEVALPVLAATMTTIIVFIPIIFLSGMGKFLFTPLALSVTFSILASYVISLTVIPAFASKWLTGKEKIPAFIEPLFNKTNELPNTYKMWLSKALGAKQLILVGSCGLFILSLFLFAIIGKELFPPSDAGQIIIYTRAPSGTRIENTEKLVTKIEHFIQKQISKRDLKIVVSNAGILYDWPAAYTPNSGPHDAFILVQLTEHRSKSSQEYAKILREKLNKKFPGVSFAFDTGGLLTAALNFGLPSPIDVQVEGNKLEVGQDIALQIKNEIEKISGTADVRIQQKLDYPQINIDIDRVKASDLGVTVEETVKSVIASVNSSVSFDPAFWIDEKTGNHYFLGVQYPEEIINSLDTVKDIPIGKPGSYEYSLLRNLVSFRRTNSPVEINHKNITRITDVYSNVSDRDVGSVALDIESAVKKIKLPEGYRINMRGEVSSMKESFGQLGFGLILSIILIYLVMVAQFKSFIDPFIIIFAVPLGLIGVAFMLFMTNTTLNIQSFIGIIFMGGIVVSNSILLVEFANRLLEQGYKPLDAILESGKVRLRPILVTSLTAILALVPMAIGIGRGAEANIPLARAVIGGLTASTFLTLFVVPIIYLMFKQNTQGVKANE